MSGLIDLLQFYRRRRLPTIIQTEATECGLACLAMISSYWGYRVDLTVMRRRFPVTLKGSTLVQLMQISHAMGMSSRPLRLDPEHMRELQLPCLLHWDFNHFIVLKKVGKKGVLVNDPAQGERHIPWSEVDSLFTGVAMELLPTPDFQKKDETSHMKLSQLWGKLHGLTKSFAVVVLLSFALQIFGIISPLYMQTVVDNVIISGDTNLLLALAIGFALLAVINATTNALRSLSIMVLSNQLNIQVASRLLHHLLRLPLSFFEHRHMGDIVSRFESLDYVRNQMTVELIESIVDGIMVVAVIVMMFIYSPLLTWIVLISAVIYLLARYISFRPIRRATEEKIIAGAQKDSNFMETVRAIQGIKLFERGAQREAVWQNYLADELNAGIRLERIHTLWGTANHIIFGLENVLVIYLGARSILDDKLSIGMLYAFVSYKGQFTEKAAALIDRWIDFRMLRLHLDRLADIVLQAPEIDTQRDQGQRKLLRGEVRFVDLAFRYDAEEPYLFQNVNITIPAGCSAALVGPSGIGKTTLFKILLGILEPTEGKILIDGISMDKYGISQLRRQTGTVMQDDQLLAGSVADNISFFSEQQDMERIIGCAKMAAIHDDIIATPMGYNMLIGDMGSMLSGGQAQRVLLARALYQDPRLLLLDEATAHLDVETERVVNQNLRGLDITRIFIAHRPETVSYADKVIVLADGTAKLEENISFE